MGWDESLFGWMWRRGRALVAPRVAREVLDRRVHFDLLAERLRTLAIAVAGGPVVVRQAESDGGVSGSVILLPAWMDFAPSLEQNERAYVLRTALAASIVRLGLAQSGVSLTPVEQTLATVIATSTAKAWLARELPASADALDELATLLCAARPQLEASALERIVRGALGAEIDDLEIARRVLSCRPSSPSELVTHAQSFARELGRAARPLVVPLWGWLEPRNAAGTADAAGDAPASLPSGTERTLRVRDRVTRKRLDQRHEMESPLVHSFEKLHTLEDHGGGNKRVDGSDELEAHADALEELELREVIRSDEETRSLLRSDAMLESGAGELANAPSEHGIPYDEWDDAKRRYRPAWCRVHVVPVEERVPRNVAERAVAQRLREVSVHVDAVKAELAHLEMLRRPRSRQLDGPEVDEDAMVERHAALHAGVTPPDRLFRSSRRHRPDLAVLLLVDTSLSTDGWVDGQRVLDVERDATLVVCEALDREIDELAVAGFSSHTRADCRFLMLKEFGESWRGTRHRVMSLVPAGYTRIGPAIRHGTSILEAASARRRLLLVVTDGKPNDYDRYEGQHGVLDVAHAVEEAHVRGVHVHALAEDRNARQHLPRMFGMGRFSVLGAPRELARAMGRAVLSMQR